MSSVKRDMGTGSVKKLMVQMAVPALVGQLVNLLYNIVDRIYIGQIVNKTNNTIAPGEHQAIVSPETGRKRTSCGITTGCSILLAESKGFEPLIRLPVYYISNVAH